MRVCVCVRACVCVHIAQTIVALAPPGTGARGMKVIVYLKDDYSPDSFAETLEGLVFYAAPAVFAGTCMECAVKLF